MRIVIEYATMGSFIVQRAPHLLMSFGGFLGMGEAQYPLPWGRLDHDVSKGGYPADIAKEVLDDTPRFARDRMGGYNRDYHYRLNNYYRSRTPRWGKPRVTNGDVRVCWLTLTLVHVVRSMARRIPIQTFNIHPRFLRLGSSAQLMAAASMA